MTGKNDQIGGHNCLMGYLAPDRLGQLFGQRWSTQGFEAFLASSLPNPLGTRIVLYLRTNLPRCPFTVEWESEQHN